MFTGKQSVQGIAWLVWHGILMLIALDAASFLHDPFWGRAFAALGWLLVVALQRCHEREVAACLWIGLGVWGSISWWIVAANAQHCADACMLGIIPLSGMYVDPQVLGLLLIGGAGVLLAYLQLMSSPVSWERKRPLRESKGTGLPVVEEPCAVCRQRPITHREYTLCSLCKQQYASEILRVRTQCYRAKRAGKPATLSVSEWVQLLIAFRFRCAYCQQKRFAVMDHVVPIARGGGTTKENVVPACAGCNASKAAVHPEQEW